MKGKFFRKTGAAILAAAMMLTMIGGCRQLEDKSPEKTVAATFGSEKVMQNELNYYIRSREYDWEKRDGKSDLMSNSLNSTGITIGDFLKSTVLTELHQTLVLGDYARKNNIALTDAQMKKVNAAVDAAMEKDAEKFAAIGADREMVLKSYTANALANDVYLELVKDVDTSVGDDEFIRKEVTFIKLTPAEVTPAPTTTPAAAEEESAQEAQTEEESAEEKSAEAEETVPETVKETEAPAEPETEEAQSEGQTEEEETTLSAEEIARNEAIASAAAEIEERLKNGEKPSDIYGDYYNNSNYTATYSTKTISETGSDVYTAAAWALAKDEVTTFTAEDGSKYILLCLNDNDETARAVAIDAEIESRKSKLFAEKYEEIQAGAPKFSVDQDILAAITFAVPAYVAPTEAPTTEAADASQEAETEAEAEAKTEAEAETEAEAKTEAEAETEAVTEAAGTEPVTEAAPATEAEAETEAESETEA